MQFMPSKVHRHRLDIRHNIHLARRFVAALSYAQFLEKELEFYAVTRCLEIISEASRRLPEELKLRHPDIPWTEIAGAGNVFRHDYEDVQHKLIWGTVHKRLPELLAVVEVELQAR